MIYGECIIMGNMMPIVNINNPYKVEFRRHKLVIAGS